MTAITMDQVLWLRQRLIDAQEHSDQAEMAKLLTTFGTLVETSYQVEKTAVTGLFVSLEDATRNTMMGVGWKASVPTSDQVRNALR